MDTSETYIKMCEKGRKLLPKWIPQEGDCFCCRGEIYIYQDLYMDSERNMDCFPLYRQDQLQDMVRKSDIPQLLIEFHIFTFPASYCLDAPREDGYYAQDPCGKCRGIGQELHKTFISMEQLWLAFVMKEKYNKVWNGDEWTSG